MNTRRYRKIGFFRIANAFVSVITLFFFSTSMVFALPNGQQVVNGQVSFNKQGNNLTITNSPSAIINWQGFSINSNEAVRFIQQYDTSAVLNRVTGQDPSQILNILQSNGRVFLVNPNGILFGQGARVDTNGFFASTLNISNVDFMGGKYNFTAGPIAESIKNQGTIKTPKGGKVFLIAPNIENSGIINTPQGDVLLAAGHNVQLVDSLDPNIAVVISAPANKAVNLGQIIAQSGKSGIYGSLIAQKGVVNSDRAIVGKNGNILFKAAKDVILGAGSITSAKGGDIRILGGKKDGTVKVNGTIDASAPNGGDGGFIETSAAKVAIGNGAVITTRAPYGKTGTWLIDPTDFTIAATGGDITGADLSNSLSFNNVSILSSSGKAEGNGDIFVNDNITWSANKLTLNAYRNIEVNRELFGSGTAQLALYYGQGAVASGNTATYSIKAPVNLPSGNNFSTKLGSNGTEIICNVINDLTSLQNINNNRSGHYALGGNIDASATAALSSDGSGGYYGFAPIGSGSSTAFTGTFDGLGHTINGLYINRPETDYVGFFGYTQSSSVIQNVGLFNVDITGRNYIGGLVGYNNNGYISNSYSTGGVSVTNHVGSLAGYDSGSMVTSYGSGTVIVSIPNPDADNVKGESYIGGLVGYNYRGRIESSYSMGSVSGTNYVKGSSGSMFVSGKLYIGGLMGYNESGSISNSYSTSTVNGINHVEGLSSNTIVDGSLYLGGLVGYNDGASIDNSYSTSAVNGANSVEGFSDSSYASGSLYAGGLVGYNKSGSISNSYSTGAVKGKSQIKGWGGNFYLAGLVGYNDGASIDNSYSTSTVNGANSVEGFSDSSYASGSLYAGGLVGYNKSGAISTSYSTGDVSGTNYSYMGGSYAGGLVGWSSGNISNSYSTGAVSGSNSASDGFGGSSHTGGLVGYNDSASIEASYSTGRVNGENNSHMGSSHTGGLVGWNSGNISNSYSTSTVSGSNSVSGGLGGSSYAGGLVGWNSGNISNSYGTGAASGSNSASGGLGGSSYVGGLLGYNNEGNIDNSYSTGAVNGTSYNEYGITGTSYVGGLVGCNANGSVSNSFWNMTTAGTANGIGYDGVPSTFPPVIWPSSIGNGSVSGPSNAGATGLTTDQMMQSANFTGFDFINTWRIYEGHTTPLLRVFLKPLTITADDVTKVYDGTSVGLTNVAYSDPAAAGSGHLSGMNTPYGFVVKNNVGVYSPDIWSDQQGYDITIGTGAGTYGTLTVTPRPVTVASITDVSTPYGTPAATGAVRLDNTIANDDIFATANIDGPIYNPGSNSMKAGSYTQSASTLSGADAGNYTLTPYTTPTANYIVQPGQTVSGMLNMAVAGKAIYFVVNGTLLADQGITDAGGNYSAMFPLNSIGAKSALLAYVANDRSMKSASVYVAPGGNINGLALYANTLSASGGTMSNTTLGTARGSVISSDIPFSVSRTDLNLMSGISFVTASGTNYSVNGAVTTLNGSQTYNGPVTLPGNATLTANGTGGITFGSPVSGSGYNLTVAAGGDIMVGGLIDVGTGVVSLSSTDGAIINGMGCSRSINAETLLAYAANGIGSGNPLMTGVHNLTAVNTVANNIEISNTGSLAVGNIRNEGTGDIILQNTGRTATGNSAVVSSGGNVSIATHSPLTIGTGRVSAYKNITLTASAGGESDILTINGPLTSSTGNIRLTTSSLIVFGPKGNMRAPRGAVVLKDGGLLPAVNKAITDSIVISLSKVIERMVITEDGLYEDDDDKD